MALLATLHDHRRGAERQPLDADATLRIDGRPLDALIANISASGCLFVCAAALDVGDRLTIGIAGLGRPGARIVRAQDQRFGAAFDTPLTPPELDALAAGSDGTVVSFLSPATGLPDQDGGSAATALPFAARLAIVAGLAAATWAALVAILLALG